MVVYCCFKANIRKHTVRLQVKVKSVVKKKKSIMEILKNSVNFELRIQNWMYLCKYVIY